MNNYTIVGDGGKTLESYTTMGDAVRSYAQRRARGEDVTIEKNGKRLSAQAVILAAHDELNELLGACADLAELLGYGQVKYSNLKGKGRS